MWSCRTLLSSTIRTASKSSKPSTRSLKKSRPYPGHRSYEACHGVCPSSSCARWHVRGFTWTPKVSKTTAPKPLKTDPRPVTLHTLGVQVKMLGSVPGFAFRAFQHFFPEGHPKVRLSFLESPTLRVLVMK